jgi:hypothetical protein
MVGATLVGFLMDTTNILPGEMSTGIFYDCFWHTRCQLVKLPAFFGVFVEWLALTISFLAYQMP